MDSFSPKKVASRTSIKGKVIIYLFTLVTVEPFAGSNFSFFQQINIIILTIIQVIIILKILQLET